MSIFSWLFPEKCALCGRILEQKELDLCQMCRVEGPDCPVSKTKYPFLDEWTALWYYEGNVRRSLLRYKFYGKRHLARSYARLLGMKLLREDRAEFDILTWIPISGKRLRKRGFDQVQLLAEKLGMELGVMPTATLKKVRHNRAQSGITGYAQRKANVMGVYQVLDAAALTGKRILLLDDILTTGATAGECARVLLTAGAKEVKFAAVAAARQHKTGR